MTIKINTTFSHQLKTTMVISLPIKWVII